MLFNSFEFLIFFFVTTTLYYISPYRWRWLLLLAASCIFYMAFIPVYILILFSIIIIDYFAARYIEKAAGPRRKFYLALSIVANVGVLCFFKYYHFYTKVIEVLFAHYHIITHPLRYMDIILPLGLSFHTFQSMSYTIEVYRGHYKAERHFGFYALYIMFFPQLVAGPIERPQNLLPQLHSDIPFRYENLWQGLRLVLWGLFKKVVIADRLGVFADAIFHQPGSYHNLQLLAGVFAFTIQIYSDFSGYSDMALGAAKCLGFDLMVNFNRPFFSKNIAIFWRRWHISLFSWFTDYLYMPIVIALRDWGRASVVAGFIITFLLCGLWHGSSPHYMAWGACQAFYFIVYVFLSGYLKKFNNKFWNILAWGLTFLAVAFSMIFFRAENIPAAGLIISKIFALDKDFCTFYNLEFFNSFSIAISLVMVSYMMVMEAITDLKMAWFNNKLVPDILFSGITLFFVLSLGCFNHQIFIYFQF
jgi:alginate O-acetyltransferase complex protein AlgI